MGNDEADLGRLRSLFGSSPNPSIALIAGEAGIGKTRLVQELVASPPPGTLASLRRAASTLAPGAAR